VAEDIQHERRIYQALYFSPPVSRGVIGERGTWDLRRGTETTRSKNSDTRIKPLALANGHGRHIAVAPKRTLASVWGMPVKYIAV
jgi:hypothetical protein